MSEQYRLLFAHLDKEQDIEQAAQALQQRLKLAEQQVEAFFSGEAIFPASDKAKALKQAKVLASLGVRARLKRIVAPAQTPAAAAGQADEQVLAALDYITSSLIRLEERLDDMDQRFSEHLLHQQQSNDSDELALDLSLDEELNLPAASATRHPLLVVILVLITLLLAILGVSYFYPDLFNF
ncbi:hypothetical protein [Pseudoalteromonas sp. T1lg75]|uniref:hypothetical protein n=1 Tax=Pseudoalteromonas sp. T1lg75 TaxID=2077102 RepID=UPI000CF73640|nr:hypothetical protein [Pseudoalteromonas sp. T1lg75]